MKKAVLIITICLASVGAVAGWIAYQKTRPVDVRLSDIRRVHIFPVTEGPQLPPFVRDPRSPDERPLRLIARFIPIPLPHPVWQGMHCEYGGDMTIELGDGRTITYGPCRRPESIDRLWGHMIDVFSHGRCRPHCEPG